MVIFDCDDFEVIHRSGKQDFLLVTFSSLGMFTPTGSMANGQLFWAKTLADKFDYSAIGFVAKARNWFCSPHMPAACQAVAAKALSFNSVITYGSSMGGYGALRWARQVNATAVIAFAPQFSIDPAIVGAFDDRYAWAFRPAIHSNMDIVEEHVGCPSFILTDRTKAVDKEHVSLIHRNVETTCVLPLDFCGHECVRVFARAELADRLLRVCAANDRQGATLLARSARKRAGIRPVELASRLLPGKSRIAEKVFIKHSAVFEIPQKAEFLKHLQHCAATPLDQTPHPPPPAALPRSVIGPSNTAIPTMDVEARHQMAHLSRRLIHMHVPKTAGTAIRTAFEQQLRGNLRVFPEWDESKYASINPEDFDFYSGHFGYETARRLDGDIVVVLRHPIDRFVSVYYFWRELYELGVETSVNTELAHKYTLDQFVQLRDQPGLMEEFQNRCTLQIAYGSSLRHRRDIRAQGQTDDMIFATAVQNLREFKVVGVQEKLDLFGEKIFATFGVRLSIRKINVTQQRPDVSDVSIAVRRQIQDWVYMDLELYQEALRMT